MYKTFVLQVKVCFGLKHKLIKLRGFIFFNIIFFENSNKVIIVAAPEPICATI